MDRKFYFGGKEYFVKLKMVLRDMKYYYILQNAETGQKLYLLNLPE